jgi:ubiquinone biosynthesis protein COQ9
LVLDAFLFHSILRDKSWRHEILSVPHGGYQNHRLDEALAKRNYRMAGTGVMSPNGLETRGNILEFIFHSHLTIELK